MAYIVNEIKYDFKDVLLKPQKSYLSSRKDVILQEKIQFKYSKQLFNGIPIIASNMDSIGTFEMAKTLSKYKILTAIHKFYTIEDWKKFAKENPNCLKYVSITVGMNPEEIIKLQEILNHINEIKFISMDVANGYCNHFVNYVKKMRNSFPNHTIIAGDVATPEMVQELITAGADIIKIGIGSGSVCTTRLKTGIGFPQLSAIIECGQMAHALGGPHNFRKFPYAKFNKKPLSACQQDGGCTCPGDVVKAFAAGADFVMLGGLFAGHDQCGGDLIEKNGEKYKIFYGLSSAHYMDKYMGGVADYKSAEGKSVEVPYKGNVQNTVEDILGGIRSACTYIGAQCIAEIPKNAIFIRCNQQINTIFS